MSGKDVLDEGLAARTVLVNRITEELAAMGPRGFAVAIGVVIGLVKTFYPSAPREFFLKIIGECWDDLDKPGSYEDVGDP